MVAASAKVHARIQQVLESIGTRYHVPWKDGSNAFVVSPKKTTNGHAFLWGAPQEGFDSPSIDWEVYQHGPNFDVGGFTIPLAPFILGVILGDQIEINLVRAVMTDSNPWLFITRPISGVLLAASVISVVAALWQHRRAQRRAARSTQDDDADF